MANGENDKTLDWLHEDLKTLTTKVGEGTTQIAVLTESTAELKAAFVAHVTAHQAKSVSFRNHIARLCFSILGTSIIAISAALLTIMFAG